MVSFFSRSSLAARAAGLNPATSLNAALYLPRLGRVGRMPLNRFSTKKVLEASIFIWPRTVL
jgi:hypothetical protein